MIRTNPDFISDINPISSPKLIWEAVKPYLDQYKVDFYRHSPDKPVNKPTITWKIIRRQPGDKQGQRKYPRYGGVDRNYDNTNTEYHFMYQTLIIEYSLYHTSSTILDDLAWDFENSVLSSQTRVRDLFPDFEIEFLSQEEDELVSQTNIECIKLRFRVVVPVTYTLIYRTLRSVTVELWGGYKGFIDREFENISLEKFIIPLIDNEVVNSIVSVTRNIDGTDFQLKEGLDYFIEKDNDEGLYIKWIEQGSVPEIGENFWLTYTVANRLLTT